MNFLPEEVVPDIKRDGPEVCRALLRSITFYYTVLTHSGLSLKDMVKMLAKHSQWFREGSMDLHERAMTCALAMVITGAPKPPKV